MEILVLVCLGVIIGVTVLLKKPVLSMVVFTVAGGVLASVAVSFLPVHLTTIALVAVVVFGGLFGLNSALFMWVETIHTTETEED